MSARIDCRVRDVSLLSANRLFVPEEKARTFLLPLGRAILRHAYELASQHPHDPAWRAWLTDFIQRSSRLHESILAELETLDEFIEVKCLIEGESTALHPTQVVACFGRFVPIVPWYYQKGSHGVVEGHWFLEGFPSRRRKGGVEEVDLERVIDALKGSYES